MKRTVTILSFLLLATSYSLLAQNGSISGSIIENHKGSKISVPFATVAVIESMQGTTTNFDGNYKIENIIPGTYKLVASFIGFKADTSVITISANENKILNKTLDKNSQLLKEFQVEAKVSRESVNILLMEQKNASEIKQSIGA
ncbi:MAG: carboxypeptidase-like regulatory domain-containing protein, partial [Flavobacteriales bacterium]